jgi:hypothetical protein
LERILQDFHFALRMLRKNAVFSTVAIATLALGAGANALMFIVIDSVLLRPLPYKNSRQLVFIDTTYTNGNRGSTSLPNFLDIRAQSQSFSVMAAYEEKSVSLRLQGKEPIHSSGIAQPQICSMFWPYSQCSGAAFQRDRISLVSPAPLS